MLEYFLDNNLIFPKQSGSRLGDSCINHLLSITHDLFSSFDNGLEVRGLWHDGQVKTKRHKRRIGMSFNGFFEKWAIKSSFKCSSRFKVNAGVLQGSILGLL